MATSRRVIVHLKDLSQCNEGVVTFPIYSVKPIENLAPTGGLTIKKYSQLFMLFLSISRL